MSPTRKRKKNNSKKFFIIIIILMIILIIWLFNKNKSNTSTNENTSNTSASSESADNLSPEPTPEPTPSVIESLSSEEIQLSKERGLPVLMYHFFYDASAGETGRDNNYMEISNFEEQIKYLSENNYYTPTWDEVLGYISGSNGLPLKSVVLTVDDGDESFFRLAVPILEKYNFKATSFVITSWYGNTLSEYKSDSIDFQSHSNNMHIAGSDGKGAFLTMSYENACADLEASRSSIGDTCKVFCYPFGHFNDKCKQTLKDCNYILAFTTKGGRVFPGDDPYELPRVRMSKGDSIQSFINRVK